MWPRDNFVVRLAIVLSWSSSLLKIIGSATPAVPVAAASDERKQIEKIFIVRFVEDAEVTGQSPIVIEIILSTV